MPGQMTDAERKRRMDEFEWGNKNPVAAANLDREREANRKEMGGGKNMADSEQMPSMQRRKGDMK
jgi:hypothetical protein